VGSKQAAEELIKAGDIHRTNERAGKDTTGSAKHVRDATKSYDAAKKR